MAPRQEDFVFAERVLQHGYATEEQVEECLSLLDRLRAEMRIEESLANLMVKKGYLAPAQAHVLETEIDPNRADRPRNRIEGYQLLERLGSGAMGSVYRAHHQKLDIPVALKVLRPSLASSRTQIERLKREAQLAARLNHPNVVRSLDVGESNGFHYLVMEFVEGQTARDLLSKGPLPEKDALAIARQVAAGLAHAHANGVVHRDVKPGNIMITPEGTAKLADFGLARGQQPSDLTLEHASIGTPQYVAPEQMRRGSDATARSDLFSLGSTLYHMVTGRPPFDGESLGEIVQNVLACRFLPPESVAKGLSRDAIYVIGRLMRSSPRERYASAAELVADLDRIGQGPIAPPDFEGDYQAFLRKRRGRRNAILAAGAAVLVCAAALFLFREWKERERNRRTQLCTVANGTGTGAVSLASAPALRDAIRAMETAVRDAGAAECPAEAVSDLNARLGAARVAVAALEKAEAALRRAGEPGANYVKIDGELEALPPGLPGARAEIARLREDLRELSDEAARSRYDREVNEGFRDLESAGREARAFATDLETRYLPCKEPWVGEVAQAPRLVEDLAGKWRGLDETRREFEAQLADRKYFLAARSDRDLKAYEALALDPIRGNPYLRSLARLAENDRSAKLVSAERLEWERDVLDAVANLVEAADPRPDRAEEVLRKFQDRANEMRDEAALKLEKVKAQSADLRRVQSASFTADRELWKHQVRERRYVSAYEGVAAVAQSGKWLDGIDDQYRQLRDRAQRMTEIPDRFLERVRKEKLLRLRDGTVVAFDDIERAPDEKDRFRARHAKGVREFKLADLLELEQILGFGDADRVMRGLFYAAEAYGVDASDPYKASQLRRDALKGLDAGDPWTAEVVEELKATDERIARGEERAQRADSELTAATAASDNIKAMALARELIETLGWTLYSTNKRPSYLKEFDRLSRLVGGGLLERRAGVPPTQFRYGGTAGPTTIIFTGRPWHPDEAAVAKDAPDRAAMLDRATVQFWTEDFRSQGCPEPEIPALVQRARTQMLLWNGPVETVPDGGYRPRIDACVEDFRDEWMDPREPGRRRPLEIGLDFPFRADAPWSIEFEARWPTAQPGFLVVALGQIQAVLGYYDAGTMGGMAGACLLVGADLDPNAHLKELGDLHWQMVNPPEGGKPPRRPTENAEKAYLEKGSLLEKGDFVEGVPYRMRLERTPENRIRFTMEPVSGGDGKKVVLEKRDRTPRQLERDSSLPDAPPRFRFLGVTPAKGKAYELHQVTITGMVPDRKKPEASKE